MPVPTGAQNRSTNVKPPAKKKSSTSSSGGYYPHGFNYQEAAQAKAQQQAMAMLAGPGGPLGPSGGGGGGGGGGRRGGGGYGGYAAAQAAERARQRQLVEDVYNQGLGQATTARDEASAALPGYLNEAMSRLAQIYQAQQAQAGVLGGQIVSARQGAENTLAQALAGLQGDLRGQGTDVAALQGAGEMYRAGAAQRGAAGQNFNDRLSQIAALLYGDQQSAATSINQGAQANMQNNYQQALAALQAQRAQQLMQLA